MRRPNTDERPSVPGGIGCEIAAKLKFCLTVGDHAVLGLRDISAETDQVQWSTKYHKWGKGPAFFHQGAKVVESGGVRVQWASSAGNNFLLTQRGS